jgi:hypothetical protein
MRLSNQYYAPQQARQLFDHNAHSSFSCLPSNVIRKCTAVSWENWNILRRFTWWQLHLMGYISLGVLIHEIPGNSTKNLHQQHCKQCPRLCKFWQFDWGLSNSERMDGKNESLPQGNWPPDWRAPLWECNQPVNIKKGAKIQEIFFFFFPPSYKSLEILS